MSETRTHLPGDIDKMDLESLGHRTDLIFSRFEGSVEDHGDHIVVRTPTRPNYFWGNFLLYSKPPRSDDLDRWRARYREVFSPDTRPTFMTFTWDAPYGVRGEVASFLDAGFELDTLDVLTATDVVRSTRANSEVSVRPLTTDADWEAAVDVHLGGEWNLNAASEEPFTRSQLSVVRRMAEAGLGRRFGAFLGDRLVGDLGIYVDEGLGRFNDVATHRDFRRQGICSSLVHEASRLAFRDMGVTTLVIAALRDSPAGRVYRTIGFEPTEVQQTLQWVDRGVHGGAAAAR